ncbi:MAG: hypothetical protein AAF512_09385 [Pseudomonadota bacterium]
MSHLCLATTIADQPKELLEKGQRLWPALKQRFDAIVVHATASTHHDWMMFFEQENIPVATMPADWDAIGLHRRRALALALQHTDCSHVMYADLDHVLRWVERYPEDLDQTLAKIDDWDCLVMGKSQEAFAGLPRRLDETEATMNHIYYLMTGHQWDLAMAARGFSRAATQLVVEKSKENTLGNDVAWPLLCETNGLKVGYTEANGLRYETNTVYATETEDVEDNDPEAWMLRVKIESQQVDAMRPFLKFYQN